MVKERVKFNLTKMVNLHVNSQTYLLCILFLINIHILYIKYT